MLFEFLPLTFVTSLKFHTNLLKFHPTPPPTIHLSTFKTHHLPSPSLSLPSSSPATHPWNQPHHRATYTLSTNSSAVNPHSIGPPLLHTPLHPNFHKKKQKLRLFLFLCTRGGRAAAHVELSRGNEMFRARSPSSVGGGTFALPRNAIARECRCCCASPAILYSE